MSTHLHTARSGPRSPDLLTRADTPLLPGPRIPLAAAVVAVAAVVAAVLAAAVPGAVRPAPLVAALVAAVVVGWTALATAGALRLVWLLAATGQLVIAVLESFSAPLPTVPSSPQATFTLWTVATTATIAAVVLLAVPTGSTTGAAELVIDVMILCSCAFVLLRVLQPLQASVEYGGPIVGLLVVVLDATALAVCLWWLRGADRPRWRWWLLGALAVRLPADLGASALVDLGPGWVAAGWALAAGGTALAALGSLREPLPDPAAPDRRSPSAALPAAAAVVTTLVVLAGGTPLVPGIRLALIAVVGLLLARSLVHTRRTAEMRRTLAHLAYHDALTGLPNRQAFEAHLGAVLGSARATVVHCDLDGFKEINDTYGHPVGDEILVEVGRRLVAALGEPATVARLGGDEFVATISAPVGRDELVELLRRAQDDVGAPIVLDGRELRVSLGVGITHADTGTVAAVVAHADLALQDAKSGGPGALRFFTPEIADRARRSFLASLRLRGAAERGELRYEYQPIHPLGPGPRPLRFEALLRWYGDDGEPVLAPPEIMAAAQTVGETAAITRWGIDAAVAQLAHWCARGMVAELSVNISPAQVLAVPFVDTVVTACAEHGVPPSLLVLELSEEQLVSDPEVLAALHELRQWWGVRVSLDDFGTGFSNLASVVALPLDEVKIDKSFLAGVPEHADDGVPGAGRHRDEPDPGTALAHHREVFAAVVRIAHLIGSSVTAEGVEHAAQLEVVTAGGADWVQGYLIGRPAPPVLGAPRPGAGAAVADTDRA